MNFKLLIQYDGTRYDGWQRQGNTDNTIQGKIEEVLSKMTGEPVELHGAGRTDAGVHASGQIANVHLTKWHGDTEEIRSYLNQYLPEDIGILDVESVPERFHSRLSAKGKRYCYRIGIGDRKNVFERRQIYPLGGTLDREAMEQAAQYLTGEHDFQGFCANKRMKKSTVRYIWSITIEESADELRITYCGNGFLYNMIRILTGTLIEVGQGKRSPQSISEIFEKKDRTLAGYTAPARGLTLEEVLYEDSV
ncbi:MAG: tRNA pseudouridine(38-40) synthase TruA [Eubacteriales bacterium]|nr:tRNA pseudouridine(38-40) synthase TruA [Eubacteriales bacterium]